jgi:ABC-2 type transport system ATP-binding protein
MIEVKNLTKVYGDRVAVDNISFTVNKGEVLGFLGQNGAGKTTTMKILTGFMPATEGTASIAGFDVFEQPLEVKKRIGYLPETPPVYKELLVGEYLSFVAELRGVPSKQRAAKIDMALQKCNLGDVRDRLIGNLSKGYRQRVGIAQALIHDPDVLVLDEPTVGLDPKQVHESRGLIKSLRSSHTVIYSTHILSEVQASCDRIIVIHKGQIVAQESLSEMGTAGSTSKTELTVQTVSDRLVEAVKRVKGVTGVEVISNGSHRLVVESDSRPDLLAEISKAVVNENAGLLRMSPVQMALEDYYLKLIGGRAS